MGWEEAWRNRNFLGWGDGYKMGEGLEMGGNCGVVALRVLG